MRSFIKSVSGDTQIFYVTEKLRIQSVNRLSHIDNKIFVCLNTLIASCVHICQSDKKSPFSNILLKITFHNYFLRLFLLKRYFFMKNTAHDHHRTAVKVKRGVLPLRECKSKKNNFEIFLEFSLFFCLTNKYDT